MYLKKILLKDYRNLSYSFLEPDPTLNILMGYNGQGKTNFLEAIYLLGTGSSHRTNLDRELINWQKDRSLIQALLMKKDQSLKLSIIITENRKQIEINNTPVSKISGLFGNLNVVLFSPEDLNLVKGGPANRRKFLDIEISQVNSYYNYLLNRYNHILKQRNNLLKGLRERKKKQEDLLPIWDEKLVEFGSKIMLKRMEVVEKLRILSRLTQRQISDGSENLVIEYEPGVTDKTVEEEGIAAIFKHDLVSSRDMEISRGYTLTGPHRDELILKINNIDVRKYGSQGQQRTTALALKLAELEFMKSEIGEYPILLLDDVFSELDEKRRGTLLGLIAERIQTFITTTDIDNIKEIKEPYQIFKFSEGKITGDSVKEV
jgi:DNA replication and repair protein RecF